MIVEFFVSPLLKKRLVMGIKIALSVGILAYLFLNVGEEGQWESLLRSPKRWGWVGLGVLACLAANLISFFRWQMMVRALGLPFSFLDSVRIGFIGLFFGLFAFGVIGGDTLRAFYVTRQVRDRISEAITSVLADRLIGILTMFAIASVSFLIFDPAGLHSDQENPSAVFEYVGWVVVACTAIGILGLVFLFFTPQLSGTQFYKQLVNIPKLGELIAKATNVVKLYRSRPLTIVLAFALSVAVNICFAISIFALATGLTVGNPSFTEHLVIEPIAMVCNAIPLPGGIGGMEFAMKYLYLAFGSNNGVIIGFAFRFALLPVSAIGAIVWFLNREQVSALAASPTGPRVD